jgi:hypothetical protein
MAIRIEVKTVVCMDGTDYVVPKHTKKVGDKEFVKLSKHEDFAFAKLFHGSQPRTALKITETIVRQRNIEVEKQLFPDAKEKVIDEDDDEPARLSRKQKQEALLKLPDYIEVTLPAGPNNIRSIKVNVLTAMGRDPCWVELTEPCLMYLRDFTTNQEPQPLQEPAASKRKHITEEPARCCWKVRFGKNHKRFRFADHGGSEGALKAAQEYLNKVQESECDDKKDDADEIGGGSNHA